MVDFILETKKTIFLLTGASNKFIIFEFPISWKPNINRLINSIDINQHHYKYKTISRKKMLETIKTQKDIIKFQEKQIYINL